MDFLAYKSALLLGFVSCKNWCDFVYNTMFKGHLHIGSPPSLIGHMHLTLFLCLDKKDNKEANLLAQKKIYNMEILHCNFKSNLDSSKSIKYTAHHDRTVLFMRHICRYSTIVHPKPALERKHNGYHQKVPRIAS